MVLSTVKRRTLLALWPDLTALPALQKKHQEKMAELQAAQLASAVPVAVFDDISPQVPQGALSPPFQVLHSFVCIRLSRASPPPSIYESWEHFSSAGRAAHLTSKSATDGMFEW